MADLRTTLIITVENDILSVHIADGLDSNTRNDARQEKKYWCYYVKGKADRADKRTA